MKRLLTIGILMAAALGFVLGGLHISSQSAAWAATPITGAANAKAGSGDVTSGRFVKLSAAGTIVTSTAVTDSVVGVCELTADADDLTRYAPTGTQTTVTSGELIAVGDLLTTGTGGKAFVLDTDDTSTQRYAAIALTAASGADESVTVIVCPGVVEQHQAIASADLNTPDIDGGTADDCIIGGATPAAVTGTTITATTFTDGTATLTGGAVTGTWDISGATVTYRSILNADVNASAAIARSKLAEDALAEYGIPFTALRNSSALALVAAAEDNEFGLTSAGFGTGTMVIDGDPASGESETSTLMFEYVLPPEYVAAGDVRLVVEARESVGAATAATTISCEAYESDGQAGAGADLTAAFDVTDVDTSWATSTSVITAAGLVAGDRLIVFVRIITDDTAGTVATVAQIGEVKLLLDIKG